MTAMTEILGHALLISGFVLVMMLVIEYLNVLTSGSWDRVIGGLKWGQSALGAFLGATPGCLGAYAAASLYMHRVLTVGALIATMTATCGDEAFVMLALMPKQALLIFALLFGIGALTGIGVDAVLRSQRTRGTPHLRDYRSTHEGEAACIPFSRQRIIEQWRHCSPQRGWLTVFLALFIIGIASGRIGHPHLGVEAAAHAHAGPAEIVEDHGDHDHAEAGGRHEGWNWVTLTLLALMAVGLAIVVTVPDHFLDEHLWNHLVRVHAWRIFLWTLGALAATHLLMHFMDVEAAVAAHRLPVLLLVCLVGIIPESGPHMVFVVLYAEGGIPFSTMLASCVVQDGHGMIPLLAHSRRAFFAVKAVKLLVGLAVGLLGYGLGW